MIPVAVALLIALGAFYAGVLVVSLCFAASRRDEPQPEPPKALVQSVLGERLRADQRAHLECHAKEADHG